MTMLKRWLAAGVAAVGFAGTAAAGPVHPVQKGGVIVFPTFPAPQPFPFPNPGPFPPRPLPFPQPFPNPPRVDFDFVVVYKPTFFGGPVVFGKFETRRGAEAAAFRLELQGFPTKIVPVRDFNNGWRW